MQSFEMNVKELTEAGTDHNNYEPRNLDDAKYISTIIVPQTVQLLFTFQQQLYFFAMVIQRVLLRYCWKTVYTIVIKEFA
jgi:hypothetical protein